MTAETLTEALPKLRAPFTPAAVQWKLQAKPKQKRDGSMGKGVAVGFINARLVGERLNDVVGGGWSAEYGPAVAYDGLKRSVTCRLTVLGSARSDVGFGDHQSDLEVALKGAYSDALKRAAVHFGIGASLYAIPRMWVDAQDCNDFGLTRQCEQALTAKYGRWVTSPEVVDRFGKAIDHGEGLTVEPAGPQNFTRDAGQPPVNVEAFKARASGRKATDLHDLLNAVGAPGGSTVEIRLHKASAEQIDEAIRGLA